MKTNKELQERISTLEETIKSVLKNQVSSNGPYSDFGRYRVYTDGDVSDVNSCFEAYKSDEIPKWVYELGKFYKI